MKYYLIICRSVTHAQRTAAVLERGGVLGNMFRIPKTLADTGCGYAVKVRSKDIAAAMDILREAGIKPAKVMVSVDGKYREADEYDIS